MQQDELLRNELLAEVESIAPILAEHAPLSEKLGRLDETTFEALRSTRLLRYACPRELGGLEAGPVTVMEIHEAVARINASASWGDAGLISREHGRLRNTTQSVAANVNSVSAKNETRHFAEKKTTLVHSGSTLGLLVTQLPVKAEFPSKSLKVRENRRAGNA